MLKFLRHVAAIALVARIPSAYPQHASVVEQQFRVPIASPNPAEVERNLKKLQLPTGWKIEVWATEPDVQHPVGFDVSDDGRVLVAESLRAWRGVPDIRPLPAWLDEDIALRTPDDRLAMMKRHLSPDQLKPYSQNSERIRWLRDTDGDGRADVSKVFVEGFQTALDGVASSVLARGTDTWFANIPNVWKLGDTNLDGIADTRRSLSYGHGVRISMLGHDLHGLVFGPDERIYVSVGDRGSRIFHAGTWLGNPECGSVFRFEPDGSQLEVFATGLRNPQELAFDDDGNLFTGDNSANTGDESRWVHVVEGADSGWHIGWQWAGGPATAPGEAPGALAPWNTESMWRPRLEGQPAYIVPPVANISAGPCGVARYPGDNLGSGWNGTFVLSDFRGGADSSGFWKFKLRPLGASFELVDASKFIWGLNATDGCWGPDGAFWLLDWTEGWEPEGRGRIYRCFDPATIHGSQNLSTKTMLAAGFGRLTIADLMPMLGHWHQRVRQAAQFELSSRGPSVIPALASVMTSSSPKLSTLHALHATGRLIRDGRRNGTGAGFDQLPVIMQLLKHSESAIRWNAARQLGEFKHQPARDSLHRTVQDPDARVRAEAAIALGKLGNPESIPSLVALITENNDRDPVIRHAAVMGLLGCADPDEWFRLASHSSPAVRIVVAVGLRRLERSELSMFLHDADHRVVREAVRAIHDVPIAGALSDLAALADSPLADPVTARRILNANMRLGTAAAARRMVQAALNPRNHETNRVEALATLAAWSSPSGRDRVTGLWRPVAYQREMQAARDALVAGLDELLKDPSVPVQQFTLRAIGELNPPGMSDRLGAIARDSRSDSRIRTEALTSLNLIQSPQVSSLLNELLDDSSDPVRQLALSLAAKGSGPHAPAQLRKVLASGKTGDRQVAFAALGRLTSPEGAQLISEWLDSLSKGTVPVELQADLVDAAANHPDAGIRTRLKSFQDRLATEDPQLRYRPALFGGDPSRGQQVFKQKTEVECMRCHKIYNQGGEVGPPLTDIGARRTTEYLLAAIVAPNRDIAEGYATTLVSLKDGESVVGTIRSEKPDSLEVMDASGTLVRIDKTNIESRNQGLSAMPEGFGEILTMRELRDLVAYLASLK